MNECNENGMSELISGKLNLYPVAALISFNFRLKLKAAGIKLKIKPATYPQPEIN